MKKTQKKKKRIRSVYLDAKLDEKIEKLAEADGRKFSPYVVRLLEREANDNR